MTYGLLYEIGADTTVRQYEIEQDEVLIGRGADCDIRLRDTTVSRHQALLTARGGCRIADLGGPNPTRVNGERLGREPRLLTDGDIITLGSSSLRFASPATQPELDSPASAELVTAILADAPAETVFNAPVEQLRAAAAESTVSVVLGRDQRPALLVHDGARTQAYPIDGLPWTLGRIPTCHILLTDTRASREHARLEHTAQGYLLRDLGSANGTFVNGARITERFLRADDTIRIGHTSIVLRPGASRVEQTSAARVPGVHAPVVLVPGLCGTELFKGEQKIWPNPLHMLTCSDAELADCWKELTVGRAVRYTLAIPGLVKIEAFGHLIDFLCQELSYTSRDLLEFGYDWRQDIRKNARQLKADVDAWRATLPDPHAKIVFIAHSMGGLVCRYYLEHLGGRDACARLIQMGTPNAGSTRIMSTIISGRHAIGLPFGVGRIQRLLAHFPSVYQLLPSYNAIRLSGGDWFDPLTDDDWLLEDCRPHLQSAIELRQAFSHRDRSLPTTCVFGYGQRTMCELQVTRERSGALTIVNEVFDGIGDDSVCESSAILDGAEIHPVMQRHGALYADKDVHRRLRYELLERPR